MTLMRITGVMSGLDTESLINQLMAIERRPIDLLNNKKETLEAQKTAWQEINTKLADLQSKLADLKLMSTYTGKVATSSNESVVTGTASSTATPATYSITVTQLAQAHSVASDRFDSASAELGFSGTFTVEGVAVTVATTDSLNSIRDKINAANAGVTATVIDNRLVITSNSTGAASTIDFVDDATTGVLKSLGILDATGAIKNQLAAAQDALFTVNNLDVTRSTNTISDVISGVTLTLKDESATAVTLEVENDTQTAVDKIKAFVDSYNALMNDIATKLAYDSDTKVAGVLQGDRALSQLQNDLRRKVSEIIDTADPELNALNLIGITTSGKEATLTVNETKLTEVLTDNPDKVALLFGASSTNGNDGVATRMGATVTLWTKSDTGFLTAKTDSLTDRIEDIEEQVERMEVRLSIREANLWRQFIALEEALTVMSAQSSWLAAQLSQMFGSNTSNTSG
ncbi:MAG: flagellar filament capping protein FliD [Bacillota bacterium]|jgi:flagellar hook-associated protein 2|nr:flagellar filament capping protein FliD [Thermoanaerobacteraceae bacterium]